MKKQLLLFGILLGFVMIIAACGNSEQATVEEAAEETMEAVEQTTDEAIEAVEEAAEEATEGNEPNTGTLVQ